MTLLSRNSKIEVNVAKKETEFAVELREQIEELREAIADFDNGKLRKAKIISNTVNMLVSDAGSNRSLLKRVGILNKLRFRVAKNSKDQQVVLSLNIDVLRGGSFNTDPIEGQGASTQVLKFGAWWENKVTVVYANISRRELIWSMRSQDGGSHYDEKLSKAAYVNVRDPEMGVTYAFTEKGLILKSKSSQLHIIPEIPPKDSHPPIRISDWKPIEGANKYAVRVIGEELSLALEREGY